MIWFLFHHNELVYINKPIIIWFMEAPDYSGGRVNGTVWYLSDKSCQWIVREVSYVPFHLHMCENIKTKKQDVVKVWADGFLLILFCMFWKPIWNTWGRPDRRRRNCFPTVMQTRTSSCVWWWTCMIGDRSKIQTSADCWNVVFVFQPQHQDCLEGLTGVQWSSVCFLCSFSESILIKRQWKQRVVTPSRRQAELLSVEHNVCCKWKGCCFGLSLWFPGYQTAPAHVQPPQVTLPCGCERHRTGRTGRTGASLCCLLLLARLQQRWGSSWYTAGCISTKVPRVLPVVEDLLAAGVINYPRTPDSVTLKQSALLCCPAQFATFLPDARQLPTQSFICFPVSAAAAIFSHSTSCCSWCFSVSSAEVSDVWVSYKSAQCFYESSSRISLV